MTLMRFQADWSACRGGRSALCTIMFTTVRTMVTKEDRAAMCGAQLLLSRTMLSPLDAYRQLAYGHQQGQLAARNRLLFPLGKRAVRGTVQEAITRVCRAYETKNHVQRPASSGCSVATEAARCSPARHGRGINASRQLGDSSVTARQQQTNSKQTPRT